MFDRILEGVLLVEYENAVQQNPMFSLSQSFPSSEVIPLEQFLCLIGLATADADECYDKVLNQLHQADGC